MTGPVAVANVVASGVTRQVRAMMRLPRGIVRSAHTHFGERERRNRSAPIQAAPAGECNIDDSVYNQIQAEHRTPADHSAFSCPAISERRPVVPRDFESRQKPPLKKTVNNKPQNILFNRFHLMFSTLGRLMSP
jgi:hypothetical protein